MSLGTFHQIAQGVPLAIGEALGRAASAFTAVSGTWMVYQFLVRFQQAVGLPDDMGFYVSDTMMVDPATGAVQPQDYGHICLLMTSVTAIGPNTWQPVFYGPNPIPWIMPVVLRNFYCWAWKHHTPQNGPVDYAMYADRICE